MLEHNSINVNPPVSVHVAAAVALKALIKRRGVASVIGSRWIAARPDRHKPKRYSLTVCVPTTGDPMVVFRLFHELLENTSFKRRTEVVALGGCVYEVVMDWKAKE